MIITNVYDSRTRIVVRGPAWALNAEIKGLPANSHYRLTSQEEVETLLPYWEKGLIQSCRPDLRVTAKWPFCCSECERPRRRRRSRYK